MDRNSGRYRYICSFCLSSPHLYLYLGWYNLEYRHKKECSAERNEKPNENIWGKYGGQLSVQEDGPPDVVFQEEGYHSPPAETLTIDPHDNDCVPQRIL